MFLQAVTVTDAALPHLKTCRPGINTTKPRISARPHIASLYPIISFVVQQPVFIFIKQYLLQAMQAKQHGKLTCIALQQVKICGAGGILGEAQNNLQQNRFGCYCPGQRYGGAFIHFYFFLNTAGNMVSSTLIILLLNTGKSGNLKIHSKAPSCMARCTSETEREVLSITTGM